MKLLFSSHTWPRGALLVWLFVMLQLIPGWQFEIPARKLQSWNGQRNGIASNSLEQHEAPSQDEMSLIAPAKRVGPFSLGETKDKLMSALRLKGGHLEQYEYDRTPTCDQRAEVHWLDQNAFSGVFIYLRDDMVIQIESGTPNFHTSDGITVDSDPNEIRSHHKGLRYFLLEHSDSDLVGGRDLIYWVDAGQGIAFETYYNRKKRRRKISLISVFRPNTEFRPSTCVEPPQKWVELTGAPSTTK